MESINNMGGLWRIPCPANSGGRAMIEIKEVITRKDLKLFINFPFKIYKGNSLWVPPLISDEWNTLRDDINPVFEFCEAKYWLAYSDGIIAGRIAGIINNRYIETWGEKIASFGWIDFVDNTEVSKALLDTVEKWARDKGMDKLHGPHGFCGFDKEGMLIEGFDEPGLAGTIYNYPYYAEHIEKHGYVKDTDWVEYELKTPESIPEKVDRISSIVMSRMGLKIISKKTARELLPYAQEVFELLNDAYKDLKGAVLLTQKQIDAYIKQYFRFVNADYIRIVLDNSGKVAAFAIAMPSMSKAFQKSGGRLLPFGFIHLMKALRKNDCIDLYLIAVRPDLQGRGVNSILMTEITKACIKNNISRGESGPELEENIKVQALWKHFNARQHKRRRSYIKSL
jgi:GNAT superfamily N-acetyltransferase